MRTVVAVAISLIATILGWALPRIGVFSIDIAPIAGGLGANATIGEGPAGGQGVRGLEPFQSYAEIEQRMLFSHTRRPAIQTTSNPAPQAPMTAAPTPDLGQFRLLGVLLHSGHRRALIRTPANPDGRWIAEGGSLDGVLIRSIASGQVTIDAAGSTGVLNVHR